MQAVEDAYPEEMPLAGDRDIIVACVARIFFMVVVLAQAMGAGSNRGRMPKRSADLLP